MFEPITITFSSTRQALTLGPLLGDSDTEYIMHVDKRLQSGFTVTGQARIITSGSGRHWAAYQFKVGQAPDPVPEPGTWLRMSTGVLRLIIYRWRRWQQQRVPPQRGYRITIRR